MKAFRTIEATVAHLVRATKGSEEELFLLNNLVNLINSKGKWVDFNLLLNSRKHLLVLFENIIKTRPSGTSLLAEGLINSTDKMREFYLKLADKLYPASAKSMHFWEQFIAFTDFSLSLKALTRIFPYENRIQRLKELYPEYGKHFPIIQGILDRAESKEDIEFIRLNDSLFFRNNSLLIAEKMFLFAPDETKSYFDIRCQLNEISRAQHGEIVRLLSDLTEEIARSKSAGKFALLLNRYEKTSTGKERELIVKEICSRTENLEDFVVLLEATNNDKFDLDFSQAVIDCFFEKRSEGEALLAVYQNIKGKIIEKYFIGKLFSSQFSFKTLDYVYAQSLEDKDFSEVIFELMVVAANRSKSQPQFTTGEVADYFLKLCQKHDLTPSREKAFLAEIKNLQSGLDFWVKVLKRVRPDSQSATYALNLIKQILKRRAFSKVYEFYTLNCGLGDNLLLLTITEVMLEIAVTRKELNMVVYIAPKDSEVYERALERQEALV